MYEFFTVIDEMHDDPTIYPVLSGPQEYRPFAWEVGDGDNPMEFTTKRMAVSLFTGNGWTTTRGFSDLTFSVVITDARVVVYCEKYIKGGGWRGFGVGGLAIAAAANVVSHARAAARRKGKVLITQVRYPWLVQAGAPADKRGRRKTLRLVVNAGSPAEPSFLALDIGLGERSGPAEYAAYVVQCAATQRALTCGVDDVIGATCAALAAGPDRSGEPCWDVPGPITVGALGSLALVQSEATDAVHGLPSPDSIVRLPSPDSIVQVPVTSDSGACQVCGHMPHPAAAACGRCGRSRHGGADQQLPLSPSHAVAGGNLR